MTNDYTLQFDLSTYGKLETFARQANKADNLGDKGDWLNHFLRGLEGLRARVLGVEIHYSAVHSWELVALPGIPFQMIEPHLYKVTEYHLSTILFNMDSAIECIVFLLNALGYAVDPVKFKDVTSEQELREIAPWNILGRRIRSKIEFVKGYEHYFPTLKGHWHENQDLILKIFEQHNVSKHRSAIFEAGGRRMDPPPDFFERLGIKDRAQQIVVSPFGEIGLPSEPKIPWRQRKCLKCQNTDKLEDVAKKFQTFINMSGVKALGDAQKTIKLDYHE